jgi:hypothetical protein
MLYDGMSLTDPSSSSLPTFSSSSASSSSLQPPPTRTAYYKSLIDHAKKYPLTGSAERDKEIKEWYRDRVGRNSGKDTFVRLEGRTWSEDVVLVGVEGGGMVKEEELAEIRDPRKRGDLKDDTVLVQPQKHPVGRVVRKEFYDVQYEVCSFLTFYIEIYF